MSWAVEAWRLSSRSSPVKISERGTSYVTGVARGYYLMDWGWVLQRTGYTEARPGTDRAGA